MSKIGSLFKNELIKIFRKKSLVVTVAVAVLLIFAIGIFVKTFENSIFDLDDDYIKEDVVSFVKRDLKMNNIDEDNKKVISGKLLSIVDKYSDKYGDNVNYRKLQNELSNLLNVYCTIESYDYNKNDNSGLGFDNKKYKIVVTEDYYDFLVNKAAIIEYRLNNRECEFTNDNYYDELNSNISSVMLSVSFSITLMMLIIIGGSAISHEISSGSIKSLIIAPVKRAKIFWAKFLSVITVGFFVYIAEFLLIFLYCMLLFGYDDSYYIFSNGSTIFSISIHLKNIFSLLISFIVMIAFAAIAIMFSSVTRNTAASVGGTMGVYYAGGIVSSILELFINKIFIKFIPFTHFSLLSTFGMFGSEDMMGMIFKYTQNSSYDFYRSYADPSFAFSAIYVVIFTALMLWIAYDSFTKRDI